MTRPDAAARAAGIRALAARGITRLRPVSPRTEPPASATAGPDAVQPPRVASRPLGGLLQASSFEAPVEVITDRAGVPHALAASRADLYRAQGFLHQAERAWQIETNSRAGQGELAALLGPRALASDAFVHRLGFPVLVADAVERAPAEVWQVMTWYAEGRRAALRVVPTTAEHEALGRRPQPPDAETALRDATAAFLLFGLTLQHDWLFDLLRAALDPADRGRHHTAPDGDPAAAPAPPDAARLVAAVRAKLGPMTPSGGGGSNAWGVAPERCAEQGPVVAGDPHLGQRSPGHWMAMHLTDPETDVIGATMPGVPDVVFGHNGRVGWMPTHAPAHAARLTLERVVDAGTAVLRPDGREPVQRSIRQVGVAGGTAVAVESATTSRGVLLGLDLPEAAGVQYDLALDCSWWRDPYPQQVLSRAAGARTAAELGAVLGAWRSIPQAVVVADTAGEVGVVQIGQSFPTPPAAPWPGWLPPRRDSPVNRHRVSLGGPIVVAANAAPSGAGEPGHWESPLRANRVRDLLGTGPRTPFAQSVRAQLDLHSPLFPMLMPALCAAAGQFSGQEAELLDRLRGWHGRAHRDRVEPTLFAAWLREAAAAAVMRSEADADRTVGRSFVESKAWLTDWGLEIVVGWLGDRSHDVAGHRQIAATFRSAVEVVRRRLGPEPADWTWGRWHAVSFRHVLDGHPSWPGRPVVIPLPGAEDTVCRGDSNTGPNGGPSLRMALNLARPDESVWSFPLGNSGMQASPHHADMLAAWAGGQYQPMPYSRAAVRGAARNSLTLMPADDWSSGTGRAPADTTSEGTPT